MITKNKGCEEVDLLARLSVAILQEIVKASFDPNQIAVVTGVKVQRPKFVITTNGRGRNMQAMINGRKMMVFEEAGVSSEDNF